MIVDAATGAGVRTLVSHDGISPRVCEAFADHQDESPLLVIDLDVVVERWRRLSEQLDGVAVSYAVKANPAPEILEVLVGLGSTFDVVSPAEVDACLAAGADPARLSYGNTVKKRSAIRHAFAKGVRTFAFDCEGELDKLIDEAPGSTAVCRIRCDGAGAARPLSRKFGCRADRAAPLLRRAVAYGMVPAVSFHVGSQQFDPEAWDRALASVADVRAELRADGVELASVVWAVVFPGRTSTRHPRSRGTSRRSPAPSASAWDRNRLRRS